MQNNKRKKSIIIGYLLITLGLVVFSYNYLAGKKEKVFTEMKLEYYSLESPVEEVKDNTSNENTDILDKEENKDNVVTNAYIGSLEIPKINLNKGFVDLSSPDNNIQKNVTIINTSDMPDVHNGNFILAAHSGTAYISYFKDLYQLNKDDYAYITYKGVKYTYKITNIYLQAKTGQVGIYRDYSKTTLTLITCTKDDDNNQTIYIAELVSKN